MRGKIDKAKKEFLEFLSTRQEAKEDCAASALQNRKHHEAAAPGLPERSSGDIARALI